MTKPKTKSKTNTRHEVGDAAPKHKHDSFTSGEGCVSYILCVCACVWYLGGAKVGREGTASNVFTAQRADRAWTLQGLLLVIGALSLADAEGRMAAGVHHGGCRRHRSHGRRRWEGQPWFGNLARRREEWNLQFFGHHRDQCQAFEYGVKLRRTEQFCLQFLHQRGARMLVHARQCGHGAFTNFRGAVIEQVDDDGQQVAQWDYDGRTRLDKINQNVKEFS